MLSSLKGLIGDASQRLPTRQGIAVIHQRIDSLLPDAPEDAVKVARTQDIDGYERDLKGGRRALQRLPVIDVAARLLGVVLVSLLALGVVSRIAGAQLSGRAPRLGYVDLRGRDMERADIRGLRDGLRELGYANFTGSLRGHQDLLDAQEGLNATGSRLMPRMKFERSFSGSAVASMSGRRRNSSRA
jgi:hypothetical protein